MSRKEFLLGFAALLLIQAKSKKLRIETVNGSIDANRLGTSLIHEHFLVDFIGANQVSFERWNRDEVIKKVLPFLMEVKDARVKSIFDCTPNFLGRDVVLLKELSKRSGLNIITNTGYYGAHENKYLPSWAATESVEQLADRWIAEFNHGIDGTFIKPGFIKISVDAEVPLTPMHKKLVRAAAITHCKTGLTICSHTGSAGPAFAQLEILRQERVRPDAFVWVHAQAEKDKSNFIKAASMGAWISLDGIGWGDFDNYADSIADLKTKGLLNRVLISHDAGWFKPDEKDGGEFTGFMNIFNELIPRLKNKGLTNEDIETLLAQNPAQAMSIRVRKR